MTAVKLRRGDYRYEVRAVWVDSTGYCQSQGAAEFDRASMFERAPDEWGVYEVCGGNVQDYTDRATAAKHCGELNGDAS